MTDSQWDAVQRRDAAADGTFVFAVVTTGIFCRPSCPSRAPRREHVRFFAAPCAAVAAGFRPCKRCRPTEPAAAPGTDWVTAAARQIDAVIAAGERPPTLAQLAAAAGISPYHLQRTFRRLLGISPRQYAAEQRRARLKGALRSGAPVTRALLDIGYSSLGSAYAGAAADLGMPPRTYQRGGAALTLTTAAADCAYGRLQIAVSARGVAAIALGAADAELIAQLTAEFPAAQFQPDDGRLSALITAVVAQINGEPSGPPRPDLPLDVQGTAFQCRVWEALRTIPPGTTRTYQQIAAQIGQPSAVRAVASAIARNRIAVLIPCHRVIRTDGTLGGYKWGLPRKAALLRDESDG